MEPAHSPPSRDRWGEPHAADAPDTLRPGRRRRIGWVAGLAGLVLVLAGSAVAYIFLKRSAIASSSAICREAMRGKDWDRLEEAAARWHWWEQDKAAPLIYLAEAACQGERFEEAADLLDRLPDGDPMTPEALLERSSILFQSLNRPVEGAEALERAVRLDPDHSEARRRLVFFYAFTLQRRKMVDHATKAIRRGTDLPETYIYLIGQDWMAFANAYQENTKWFRAAPEEEMFLVGRAVYRIRTRGLDDVDDPREDGPRGPDGIPYHRKVITDLCARFPKNLELLAYQLERSSSAGDADDVARLLSAAPEEASDDHRFWRYRGWLHMTRGDLQEAESAYRRALALNCYDHVSRHQLAAVMRRFRRMDAVNALEEQVKAGKALRKEILQLESVAKVPPETLRRMADYATSCGDQLAAAKLSQRIQEWSAVWARERARAQAKPGPKPENPPAAPPK